MLESFTGVLEALVVLICVSVHHFTFRVLRRFGLNVPCSCRSRLRKHPMSTADFLNENFRNDYYDRPLSKDGVVELTTLEGSVDTLTDQVSKMSTGVSRFEMGGNDNQCHSSSIGDAEVRAQEDIDSKNRELYGALQSERETLALLYNELEQERNCAATAASEALAMIFRLQEEKAAVQLEAQQFQRMVLEKAMHDQEAIDALNELLVRREEEKLGLEEEIRVCRERLDCVMKEFSSANTQLYTALVQDRDRDTEAEFEVTAQIGSRSISVPKRRNGAKVGKYDGRYNAKPEENRFGRWGQDAAQKSLDQINEDRRIEERRLSVLEYVWKFEQQQREQGKRLPVQMSRRKSAGDSRSKSRGSDVNESTDLSRKDDQFTLRVLTRDNSSQRAFDESSREEHFVEERTSNGCASLEADQDGGRCEGRPSCIGSRNDGLMDSEDGINGIGGCAKEHLFVHDVYEVQKSPYDVAGPAIGDVGSLYSLVDVEMQQTTPSDRLDKPDLHTFERYGDRDSESDQETKCLIHPSHLHEEVEDSERDSQWEDLRGKVRYKNLRISSLIKMDNSKSGAEEEVEQLTHRLKALEADRYLMKQTIESLRRENKEMKLLQDLVQQLWEVRGTEQHGLWPRTRMSTTLQCQDVMSFTSLRTPAQAHINKLAQACLQGTDTTSLQEARSVGLGRLLQHSPKGLPGTCLTRVRKAEEIILPTTLFLNKEK